MKIAQKWHDDGVADISSTLHRVRVNEIAAIQVDALREARKIAAEAEQVYDFEGVTMRNPALDELDKLIHELERKTASR